MENNNAIIHFIYKHRLLIFLSLLVGGLLGVGITFLIPKKYTSTAVVYPFNSHTREDIIANPQFGFEEETEQLLQLLESNSMQDRTIKHFKLYDYYDLDTNESAWRTELTLKYVEDVNFVRSKYLSVIINVQTTVPQLSADIANFQVEEVNQFRKEIFQENREKELNGIKQQLDAVTARLTSLKDSIYALKTDKQDLIFNFMENLNNENYDAGQFVDSPELETIIQQFIILYNTQNALAVDYKDRLIQFEAPIPSVYKVDMAQPTYKKSSPSFLLNGILSAFILLIMSLTITQLRKKWFEIKQELKG